MGNDLTKFCRLTFEILNETFTGLSSGLLGLTVLIMSDWSDKKLIPTVLLGTITIGCIYYVYNDKETLINVEDKLIVITGCDTGLGYSLALYTNIIGFKVIAGCMDVDGAGAIYLKSKNIVTYKLDLTNEADVRSFVTYVEDYIRSYSNLSKPYLYIAPTQQ